jgi:nicotinamidase-related amidase
MNAGTSMPLRLLGRHWETPDLAQAGWRDTWYDLHPEQTGFVALHLWNLGEPGGPPVPDRFFVGMGLPGNVRASAEIAEQVIRPAIDASRAAGLGIFHVEPLKIARKYRSHDYLLDERDLARRPSTDAATEPDLGWQANPGWVTARHERTHGCGYQDWDGWDQLRIMDSCAAAAGDQVIVSGQQLHRICRERGIKNLIYTGFATNVCILDAPAATKEMLGYGYRVFLIREGTLAVEYPETLDDRLVTEVTLKFFQRKVGDTVGVEQYLHACRTVAAARSAARGQTATR